MIAEFHPSGQDQPEIGVQSVLSCPLTHKRAELRELKQGESKKALELASSDHQLACTGCPAPTTYEPSLGGLPWGCSGQNPPVSTGDTGSILVRDPTALLRAAKPVILLSPRWQSPQCTHGLDYICHVTRTVLRSKRNHHGRKPVLRNKGNRPRREACAHVRRVAPVRHIESLSTATKGPAQSDKWINVIGNESDCFLVYSRRSTSVCCLLHKRMGVGHSFLFRRMWKCALTKPSSSDHLGAHRPLLSCLLKIFWFPVPHQLPWSRHSVLHKVLGSANKRQRQIYCKYLVCICAGSKAGLFFPVMFTWQSIALSLRLAL